MRSRLDIVLDVLHEGTDAALATSSLAMPGFPFVTSVPYTTDERHRPVLLISGLAEHTRNLAADARASLMIRGPGRTADAARITLVGRIVPFEASAAQVERHLRYQPEARRFLSLGDFGFHRMAVERIRTIGGFGQAGWLEGSRLDELPWLSPEQEGDLLSAIATHCPADATPLGVDMLGLDLQGGAGRLRLGFAEACRDPGDVVAAARIALAALQN